MGSVKNCALWCASCCFLFIPFIFQSVGFFTPMWASNTTCDSIGLVYSCCSGSDKNICENTNGGDELDVRALGLQATSLAVMFLAVLFLCCGACCKGDKDYVESWLTRFGGYFLMLYPVAGLFSFFGCIIVSTKFYTSELGYSFYLCLTSGLLIKLLICIAHRLLIFRFSDDIDVFSRPSIRGSVYSTRISSQPAYPGGQGGSSDVPYAGGGQVAPYEPRQAEVQVEAQHAEMHQAVAIHDEETGGIFVFMRKINVTRIVASVKHP